MHRNIDMNKACAFVAIGMGIGLAGPAGCAADPPVGTVAEETVVAGDLSCAEARVLLSRDLGDASYTINPPVSATYGLDWVHAFTAIFEPDLQYVRWTSTLPVSAIVVKAGPFSRVWDYAPARTSAVWTRGIIDPATEQPYPIDSLQLCYHRASCTYGDGTVETAAPRPFFGWAHRSPAMAVLPDGTVYAALYDGDLEDYLVWRKSPGGAWTYDSNPVWTAWGLTLVADRTGTLHGVVRRVYQGASQIVYLRRAPGAASWRIEAITETATAENYLDLAVDPRGSVHVSYADAATQTVRYAFRPPAGGWTIYPIVSAPGGVRDTSIALAENGSVHVTFSADLGPDRGVLVGHARKARDVPAPWTVRYLDAGVNSSLAIGVAGDLHVSYYDAARGNLLYATRPAGASAWSFSTVEWADDVGAFSQLGLDAAGGVHIVYVDQTNGDVRYAYKPLGSAWKTRALASTDTIDARPALVVAPSGVHVALRHGELLYAHLPCLD